MNMHLIIMKFVVYLFIIVFLEIYSSGQVVDISEVWEIKCPQGCSCEVQKFADLPLHQWVKPYNQPQGMSSSDFGFKTSVFGHPLSRELLKVATCIITDNPEELVAELPSDIQVFTILESPGKSKAEMQLSAAVFQHFPELISLDIQGADYDDPFAKIYTSKRKGIVLSADALHPLRETLLYLNLQSVKLTSSINKNKANLVVQPINASTNEKVVNESVPGINGSRSMGHRLIFLNQQNNADSDDKEMLPYNIYKQEMEGYKDKAGLLTGLYGLTHLRVYNCALKDISWHMFDGLNNLIYLSLERNNLKFIPEFCFYGTPNLRLLSLAHNQLLTMNSVDLAGLLILEELDLRGNNLTFLSELSFPPFPSLKIADFQDNPLDSVFPSTFEVMNTTLNLYLGGIGSRLKLQKNSFLGLYQLRILHLYNLDMQVLERFILQGMPALTTLKMQGNIMSIEFDAFADLGTLLNLDLSSCHIQQISVDAFYGLDKVQKINLSDNELESVPPGLFTLQQQKSLREIILTKNRLTKLPWDFFKSFRSLNKQLLMVNIRLNENPWDCTCNMANWNPNLVDRARETAPRCSTPKRLQNWGVFQALKKGGLQCKRLRRWYTKKHIKPLEYGNNIIH